MEVPEGIGGNKPQARYSRAGSSSGESNGPGKVAGGGARDSALSISMRIIRNRPDRQSSGPE